MYTFNRFLTIKVLQTVHLYCTFVLQSDIALQYTKTLNSMTPNNKTAEQLSEELKSKAAQFTHQHRMQWAVNNNVSLYTVDRYMRGEIGSTIVAAKLLEDIEQVVKAA